MQGPLPILAAAIRRAGSCDAEEDRDGAIRQFTSPGGLGARWSRASPSRWRWRGRAPGGVHGHVLEGALDGCGLMRPESSDALHLAIPVNPWSGA